MRERLCHAVLLMSGCFPEGAEGRCKLRKVRVQIASIVNLRHGARKGGVSVCSFPAAAVSYLRIYGYCGMRVETNRNLTACFGYGHGSCAVDCF